MLLSSVRKKIKVNRELNSEIIFMFSSVHNWMDTRIWNKEIASLIKYGKKIEYYAIGLNQPESIIEGLEIHLLAEGSKKNRPKRWSYIFQQALKSEAKFYHFHDPELLYVAKKIKKYKPDAIIIYDMHEYFYGQISTKDWIPRLARKPVAAIVRYYERKWMKSCDGVIFAEKSYQQYFENYQGKSIDILNYPIWISKIDIEKSSLFTLIYVGDITEDRNVYGMLEIARLLKERSTEKFQLKLIGSMSDQIKESVQKMIMDYGLSEIVNYYGRVPYTEIWEHYFSAHVGLCLLKPIPNYRNSMATKLYEYMAANLPIIASDFPLWISLVETHQCGYTASPSDYNRIVELIEQLRKEKKLVIQLGKKGRKSFEENYNWENEEIKLIRFYDSFFKKDTM